MRKLILLGALSLTMLLFSIECIAQSGYQDVVYLKNGGVIHGLIIEQIPNKTIKIQTIDENIYVFKLEEIDKITKELTDNKNKKSVGSHEERRSGYTNITEANLGLGLGNYAGETSFGIQTINGFKINPYFSVGLGVGVDKYKSSTFLPLFADFRLNLLDADITPFFSGGIGYSLGLNGDQGGLMANPAIGVKFKVSTSTSMNFSFGYRLQQNTFEYFNYYGYYRVRESASLLNLKFGLTF